MNTNRQATLSDDAGIEQAWKRLRHKRNGDAGWLVRSVWLVLMALLGMASVDCFAVTCTYGPVPGSLSFVLPSGSYSIPRDTPVGTRITPWTGVQRNYPQVWTCTPVPDNTTYAGPAFISTLPSSGLTYSEGGMSFPVFQTNLNGVGLIIGANSRIYTASGYQWSDAYFGVANGAGVSNTSWASAGTIANSGTAYDFGAGLSLAFVKTGPITAGAISMSGAIAKVGMADRPIASPIAVANITVTGNPTFAEIGCTTPNVVVNMGTHSITEFSGVGSTSSSVPFSINLNSCPSGITKVQYEVDAVTTVLDSTNSVVALSSGSTAAGVGVQLLDDSGTPMPLGRLVTFSGYSTAGGNFGIPLKARYYQVPGSPVLAGSANSVMTFTMNYQ